MWESSICHKYKASKLSLHNFVLFRPWPNNSDVNIYLGGSLLWPSKKETYLDDKVSGIPSLFEVCVFLTTRSWCRTSAFHDDCSLQSTSTPVSQVSRNWGELETLGSVRCLWISNVNLGVSYNLQLPGGLFSPSDL